MSRVLLRAIPKFPSNVEGSVFVTVLKANGIWTIAPDFSVLETPVINNLQIFETVVWNAQDDSYGRVPLSQLLGASYFPTDVSGDYNVAPNETYLRCNLASPATIILGASAARSGLKIGIKDAGGNAATNNITVQFFGTEKADGLSTVTLNQNFQYLEMVPNSAGWEITHYA